MGLTYTDDGADRDMRRRALLRVMNAVLCANDELNYYQGVRHLLCSHASALTLYSYTALSHCSYTLYSYTALSCCPLALPSRTVSHCSRTALALPSRTALTWSVL